MSGHLGTSSVGVAWSVRVELIAQCGQRSADLRFYRAQRQVRLRRDLGVAKAAKEGQAEKLALLGPQLGQGDVQRSVLLGGLQQILQSRHQLRGRVEPLGWVGINDGLVGAPQTVQSAAAADHQHPAQRRGPVRVVGGGAVPDLNVYIVGHFFGGSAALYDAQGQAEDSANRQAIESFQGALLTGGHALQKRHQFGRAGPLRHRLH